MFWFHKKYTLVGPWAHLDLVQTILLSLFKISDAVLGYHK